MKDSVRHRVDVISAGQEHEQLLANLLNLYIHDLSEFIDLVPEDDGRFVYPWLPLYWQEPDRLAFLVYVDGKIAGFVLVTKVRPVEGDQKIWDVAEFFVLRGFRRRGIGATVAHEIWSRLGGRWEVRVRDDNIPALEFWRRTVTVFTGSTAKSEVREAGDKRWQVFALATREH